MKAYVNCITSGAELRSDIKVLIPEMNLRRRMSRVVKSGVAAGIEKISKFMMPAFYVFFLIIAVRVAFLPGAMEGYLYLLRPDWSYLLNPETWVMAMGQAFFSLSINGAGMLIYGSYMKKSEDIIHQSIMTAMLYTAPGALMSAGPWRRSWAAPK